MTDKLMVQLETVAKEVIREVQVGRLTNAKLDVIGKYSQEAVEKTETVAHTVEEHSTRVDGAIEMCKESVVAIATALDGVESLREDTKQYDDALRNNAVQLDETKNAFMETATSNKAWMDELWSAQDSQLSLVRGEMTKSLEVAKSTNQSYEEIQLSKRLAEMGGELEAIQHTQNEFERVVNETLNQLTLSVTLIQQQGEAIATDTKALVGEQSEVANAVNELYARVQASAIPLHIAQSTRIENGMADTEHVWFELVNASETSLEGNTFETEPEAIEEQQPVVEKKSFLQRLKATFKGE